MRIEELERQLFVANGIAQGVTEEKRKIKQDHEAEIERLHGEDRERRLVASYEMQKATRESNILMEELATLRAQLAAKEEEHPKDNTASKNPRGTAESPLDNAGLQAEIQRLKKVKKEDNAHILEVRGMVESLDRRILNDIKRLQAAKLCIEGLREDVASYRDLLEEVCRDAEAAEEAQVTINQDAQRHEEDAEHMQQKFEDDFATEMEKMRTTIALFQSRYSSIDKVTNLGLQTASAARVKSYETWNEMQGQLGRSYRGSVAKARNCFQQFPTTTPTMPEKKSNVAPASETPSGDQIEGKIVETPSAPKSSKDDKIRYKEGENSATPEKTKNDEFKDIAAEVSLPANQEAVKGPPKPQHRVMGLAREVNYSKPSQLQQDKLQEVQSSVASCRDSESNPEMQTALLKQKEHQESELVSMLESEIEKARRRYQDLEGQIQGLEQRYREHQDIHAKVAEENAVLNKKIGGTLEAFIPKAEKMLHKGVKMDKNTRDMLNSLIKIVRDGLRQG